MIDVTFKEYQVIYADIQDEAEYQRIFERAKGLLRGWTARRIDDVTSGADYRYEQVRTAIVHVIHSLVNQNANDGVVSVSNDGYSETYASAKDRESELKSTIFDILSGTGLMGCM
nr:MAG TPA: putative head-tail connector protein [Caudoviricetes sp.]